MRMSPLARRVILPLDSSIDEERVLLPATVIASWFGAPLQIVTSDPAAKEHYELLAAALGVPIEPVVAIAGENAAAALADHAAAHQPAICVTTLEEGGLELARLNEQTTFIIAAGRSHRMASGPLVLPLDGRPSDVDALALAASWARDLDLAVRVVTDRGSAERAEEHLAMAGRRLGEMGVVCEPRQLGDSDDLLVLARSWEATAIVTPADRLDDDLTSSAIDAGVAVLIAPLATDERSARPAIDLSDPASVRGPAIDDEFAMTEEACRARFLDHSLGRLGYVDDGWPVVIPVNYAMHDGDIFIRSLPGAKLAVAAKAEVVCIEVDSFDEASRSGWSVLAHGPLEVITDPKVLRTAWNHDPTPWVAADDWQWLRIRTLSMSGRTVTGSVAVAVKGTGAEAAAGTGVGGP